MVELYVQGWLPFFIGVISFATAAIYLLAAKGHKAHRATGGLFIVITLTLIIGLRPLSSVYVDMPEYAALYERLKLGMTETYFKDPLFNLFTSTAAATVSLSTYFVLCAALYVVPKAWACRTLCGPRWPLALAVMATSFSFYGYAANGIRNGIAASLAFLAIAWTKKLGKVAIGVAAVMMHASLILTMAAHAVTWKFRSVKLWLWVWIGSIPASLLIPSDFVRAVVALKKDSRSTYFDTLGGDAGFRIDFILYSLVGVVSIAYWKYYKSFKDDQYDHLASTYLLTNAFWIVINQISYSNRFAYLSWFLIEMTILMPLLRSSVGRGVAPVIFGAMLCNSIIFAVVS